MTTLRLIVAPTLLRDQFRAMGTECAITVATSARRTVGGRPALVAGRREVDACERALSRFDPTSDLSRLNATAGSWQQVDERLVGALARAVQAREETGGRFDPTVLPVLLAAGYDRSFERVEPREPGVALGWRPGARIDVDVRGKRARVEAGAAVDLGGIGKGFSADRALEAMRVAVPGLEGALVDLGGDIAVAGAAPDGGRWRIRVADPRNGGSLGELHLSEGGVATSGPTARRFGPGASHHHLIDPRTAKPAVGGPLSVTVAARDAATAEAHATALAIEPPERVRAYAEEHALLGALVVPADGTPIATGDLLHLSASTVAA